MEEIQDIIARETRETNSRITAAISGNEMAVETAKKFGAVISVSGEKTRYTGTICMQPSELSKMIEALRNGVA